MNASIDERFCHQRRSPFSSTWRAFPYTPHWNIRFCGLCLWQGCKRQHGRWNNLSQLGFQNRKAMNRTAVNNDLLIQKVDPSQITSLCPSNRDRSRLVPAAQNYPRSVGGTINHRESGWFLSIAVASRKLLSAKSSPVKQYQPAFNAFGNFGWGIFSFQPIQIFWLVEVGVALKIRKIPVYVFFLWLDGNLPQVATFNFANQTITRRVLNDLTSFFAKTRVPKEMTLMATLLKPFFQGWNQCNLHRLRTLPNGIKTRLAQSSELNALQSDLLR